MRENERLETAWIYNRLEFRGDNFEILAKAGTLNILMYVLVMNRQKAGVQRIGEMETVRTGILSTKLRYHSTLGVRQ